MKNSHLITMVLLAGCGVEAPTEGRRHHDVQVNVHSRISCQPAMSRQVPQIITPATASTPTTIMSAASGAPSDILSMNSQPSAPGWCRVVEIQQQTLLTQHSPPVVRRCSAAPWCVHCTQASFVGAFQTIIGNRQQDEQLSDYFGARKAI
jgi:hypothetical protein